MKVVILDGYVDEPSNFGVPPYISPYPRYAAGAIRDAGHTWEYVTIDRARAGHPRRGDLRVVISVPIVPGKYLRSLPISEKEIVHHAAAVDGPRDFGRPRRRRGGPASRGTRGGEFPPRRPGEFLHLPGHRPRIVADAADQRARDPIASRGDPGRGAEPQGSAHGQRRSGDDDRASGGRDGGDAGPRPPRVPGEPVVVRPRIRGPGGDGGEQPEHRRRRMPRGDPHGKRGRSRARRERDADALAGPQLRRGLGRRDEEDLRPESGILAATLGRGPLDPPDQHPPGPTGPAGVRADRIVPRIPPVQGDGPHRRGP